MSVSEQGCCSKISTYWSVNLFNARQDVRYSSVHCIIWAAAVDCEEGVATEDCLGQYGLKRQNRDAFFMELSVGSVDGISQERASSLHISGMLFFPALMEFDAFPLKYSRVC